MLFGKMRKNIKSEKLLQIMCLQSQEFEKFSQDEPSAKRYILTIVKMYGDVATLT
jgi:hypothetical protein